MITTFKQIFQGRRELFKGLKIDKTDYDWKVPPVIHLDFSFCAANTYAGFMEGFPNTVKQTLLQAGFDYVADESPAVNLGNAIEWFFAKGMPCVILIDEYDDPVAKALADPAEADESWVGDTVRHLGRCEFDDFFQGRKSLFAYLPYGAKEGRVHEMGYERALRILFWSQGLETVCEDPPACRRGG